MQIFSRTRSIASSPPPLGRRHLLFVVRFFLGLAVLSLLVWFGLSLWGQEQSKPSLASLERLLASPGLVNLRITGRDDADRPYILTAHSVRPKSDSVFRGMMMQTGQLTQIEANLELGADHWLSLKSPQGDFDTKRQSLSVGEGFEIYTSSGYQMHGSSASIGLKTGKIIVDGQIEGWGPLGEMTAAAVEAGNIGFYMRFYGGVDVVLYLPR